MLNSRQAGFEQRNEEVSSVQTPSSQHSTRPGNKRYTLFDPHRVRDLEKAPLHTEPADSEQYVRATVRIGIQGYLLKDASQEALVQALRDVGPCEMVLLSLIASKVARSYSSDVPASQDVTTEKLMVCKFHVLQPMHQGYRSVEIGQRLGIFRKRWRGTSAILWRSWGRRLEPKQCAPHPIQVQVTMLRTPGSERTFPRRMDANCPWPSVASSITSRTTPVPRERPCQEWP